MISRSLSWVRLDCFFAVSVGRGSGFGFSGGGFLRSLFALANCQLATACWSAITASRCSVSLHSTRGPSFALAYSESRGA